MYMYITVPKQNGLKAPNRGGRGTQPSTFLTGKLSPKRIMFQLILEKIFSIAPQACTVDGEEKGKMHKYYHK